MLCWQFWRQVWADHTHRFAPRPEGEQNGPIRASGHRSSRGFSVSSERPTKRHPPTRNDRRSPLPSQARVGRHPAATRRWKPGSCDCRVKLVDRRRSRSVEHAEHRGCTGIGLPWREAARSTR
jgi:hypothetical protein